jgi:serine/threonine protein kinase
MTPTATLETIAQAKHAVEIFGNLEDPPKDKLRALELKYRKLYRETHPDVNGGSEISTQAFQNVKRLKAQAVLELEHGIYGKPPLATIKTKRHCYTILQPLGVSGAAHSYSCLIDRQSGVFTVAQTPLDNDLLQTEAQVLRLLREPNRCEASGYLPMLPELVESFIYGEANGTERQASTFKAVPGYISLAAIQEAYPAGVDPRDMAWMWRRLLDLLGYVHSRGVIHGAVLPSNVLIGTGDHHEVILTNWQAAAGENAGVSKHIAYMDTAHKPWYPPEVIARRPPTPGTDILMSARCMIALLGGDPLSGSMPPRTHRRIAGFLKSCLIIGTRQRPQDAWKLRAEFTELIDQLWRRQYRPFMMPPN